MIGKRILENCLHIPNFMVTLPFEFRTILNLSTMGQKRESLAKGRSEEE